MSRSPGEPFAVGEAARLQDLRLVALELRHALMLALGRHHEIVGELTGTWTAEMFLMFELRRLDVWPVDDTRDETRVHHGRVVCSGGSRLVRHNTRAQVGQVL
jgi:hypothetical protein